jgi:hypothetical protein
MSRAYRGNRSTVAPVCSGSSTTCCGAWRCWRRRRNDLLQLALLGCWCYKNTASALAFMYEPKTNWSPLLRIVPGHSTVYGHTSLSSPSAWLLHALAQDTCIIYPSINSLALSLSHSLRPYSVSRKFYEIFQILHHIRSLDTCIKH